MKEPGLIATVVAIAIFCPSPHRIAAQNANIYYSHTPSGDTTANPRLTYLLSGERTGNGPKDRHVGQPPRLDVPLGSKTCFEIENSNLLLYDYEIQSKAIAIAASEDYATVLAVLSEILRIPAATAEATRRELSRNRKGSIAQTDAVREQQAPIDSFTEAISGIVVAAKKLDSLKNASDIEPINYSAADAAKLEATESNRKANEIFADDSENVAIQALRPAQATAFRTATKLYQAFSDTRALGAPQYCVDIQESPVHITLKATRKEASKDHPRPIGDVVQVDVEPVNEKQFEILPVGIVTFAVPGAKTFYLDSKNLVQERSDKGAYFPSAGALAAFRLTRLVWVGAAAAKGKGDTPDSFVGFLFRNPSVARFFVLGIGAGFASVPTHLQEGTTINNLLPPSEDLSKVIKKSTHVGLSIVVAMTGLSLSK